MGIINSIHFATTGIYIYISNNMKARENQTQIKVNLRERERERERVRERERERERSYGSNCLVGTLRASLSGTFLQTLPEIGYATDGPRTPSRSCPLTLSAEGQTERRCLQRGKQRDAVSSALRKAGLLINY